MAKVYFAVRAEVPEADRAKFDQWYETDHLPLALRVFKARRAWRCWSKSDNPDGLGVHVAFYEFDSVAAVEAALRSGAIKPLIEDFDRVWQGRVICRNAVLDVVQEITP